MNTQTIYTREDLDNLTCAVPGCDHSAHDSELIFHSKCHPTTPTWAVYDKGLLTITCGRCKRTIVVVEVAERSQS